MTKGSRRSVTTSALPAPGPEPYSARGRVRWLICVLLFFATTINYMDRQVIGILAPYLQRNIGWNDVQYGYIVTAFQAAYALGLLLVNRMIDRVGTQLGYAISIAVWTRFRSWAVRPTAYPCRTENNAEYLV